MGFRPGNEVARGTGPGSGVEKKYLPPLTEMEFEVEDLDAEVVGDRISTEIKELEGVLWKFDKTRSVGMFMAREGDVWSRKARRKMKAQQEHSDTHRHANTNAARRGGKQDDTEMRDDDSKDDSYEEEPEPALVARILVKSPPGTATANASRKTTVRMRHLQGHDAVLFESFCGWLKRKVVPQ